ncbi:MAG: type II toxin-antitoxin system HicB family antitoxin [Chloroflexota bacterium]|nr:MAG: hypothetical protein DLM70_06640 [Chloroflexota bacterium]
MATDDKLTEEPGVDDEIQAIAIPDDIELPVPDSYLDDVVASAVLEWLPESGAWFATAPGIQGAWAIGETKDIARSQLHSVVRDWLRLAAWKGNEIPAIARID